MFHTLYRKSILSILTTTLLVNIVMSTYSTIKLIHVVIMPGYLYFPLCLFGLKFMTMNLFPSSYRVNKMSAEIIKFSKEEELLAGKRNKSLQRRILKSCPALRIHVGSFYYIQQSTVSSFMRISVEQSVNLILAF